MAIHLLLLPLAAVLCHVARAEDDSGAFVQRLVQEHIADEDKQEEVRFVAGTATEATPLGPMAYTALGPVRGTHQQGYDLFAGVPYVEKPARFAKSMPKKPWGPKVHDASAFGPGCIGAHTEVLESEDCLNANIWLPPGGKQNMPVIVYLHGGINQHGSGQESWRQGDLVVTSRKYPVIWINFDFRLGIFGWIYGKPGSNITNNLGFMDQQELLRWVHHNIAAFGGDPTRVILQGQSEGCGLVLHHMVAPGSMKLFHRAALHSPPADFWSRSTNEERTNFILQRVGCKRQDTASTMACLEQLDAQWVMGGDWATEELSKDVLSPGWFMHVFNFFQFAQGKSLSEAVGAMGWHPVVDGTTIPGEPRELIRQGKYNKVPVLMTVSPNETMGVFPAGRVTHFAFAWAFDRLLKKDDLPRVRKLYQESLQKTGVTVDPFDADAFFLDHQILTDKVFMCDSRTLARDMTETGGRAHLGMFWKRPKYDPAGRGVNFVCEFGATCHAAEMMYVLPQGRGKGVHGFGMEKELEFVDKYMNEFLAYVYGEEPAWAPYDLETEPITFYDESGPRVVPGYRKQQCDILDSSMGHMLPKFMHMAHHK